jgi:hypothetical protein
VGDEREDALKPRFSKSGNAIVSLSHNYLFFCLGSDRRICHAFQYADPRNHPACFGPDRDAGLVRTALIRGSRGTAREPGKIRETADSKVDARFRMAIAAYREAMSTDDAAMDFYLKCIEKVNFEDQQRKNADFREWKRREGDKLSEQGFRLALRYQLRWLILTLRAASEKPGPPGSSPEAQEIVDSIFRDAAKLGEHGQTLSQPVTSTIFRPGL